MADRYDEQLFLAYVEGELEPEQRDRFEALMAEDPKLRSLVRAVSDDRLRLRQLADENPPTDSMESIDQQLERNMLLDAPLPELRPNTPPRGLRLGRVLTMAGLAAMVLICTAVVIQTLIDQNLYEDYSPMVRKDLAARQEPAQSNSVMVKQDDRPTPDGSIRSQPMPLGLVQPERQLPQTPLAMIEPPSHDQLTVDDTHLDLPHQEAPRPTHVETFARLVTVPDHPLLGQEPGALAKKVFRHLSRTPNAPTAHATEQQATDEVQPQPGVSGDDGIDAQNDSPVSPTATALFRVTSPTAIATQQQLLAWALEHQAAVLAFTWAPSSRGWTGGKPSAAIQVEQDPPTAGRMTLAVTARQLTTLLNSLDQHANQSAQWVAQAPPLGVIPATAVTPPPPVAILAHRSAPGQEEEKEVEEQNEEPEQAARRRLESVAPLIDRQVRGLQPPVTASLPIDLDRLPEPLVPLQPVVPVYPPDTPVTLTVIIEQQPAQTTDP